MASDLLKHLETLERFGERLNSQEKQANILHDWHVETSTRPRRQPSVAADLLELLGAMPEAVAPADSMNGIPVGGPSLRFNSVNMARLEESLTRLESFGALLDLLEQGSAVGAFAMVDDRVLVLPQDGERGPAAQSRQAGVDVTEVVQRAALALKARDAAPLLSRMSVSSQAGSDPRLPTFVRLRRQEGAPAPVLRELAVEAESGLRRRVREFFRRHPTLANADELGKNPTFVIHGDPIRLPDGRYLPLEAVQEEARAGLLERLATRGRSGAGPVAYARLEDVEEVQVPEPLRMAAALGQGGEDGGLPSAGRIELAWRLVKGLSLSGEQGDPMEVTMRSRLEQMLGSSFANVRLHTGPAARFITESLSARAVSAGEHVFIPAERLSDPSGMGHRTLVHELVHVRQQARGAGTRSRSDLEAEASRVERRVPLGFGPSFTWPTKVVPPAPPPVRNVPAGVYLADKGQSAAPATGQEKASVDMRSEEWIKQLEERFKRQDARTKEEMRDRVF